MRLSSNATSTASSLLSFTSSCLYQTPPYVVMAGWIGSLFDPTIIQQLLRVERLQGHSFILAGRCRWAASRDSERRNGK